MSKLPIVSPKELEKILLKLGFQISRQKGSHRFYKHLMGDILPYLIIKVKTLRGHSLGLSLREINLEVDEYIRLLKE